MVKMLMRCSGYIFTGSITCRYPLMKFLAGIVHVAADRHIISLHSILNHPDTPEFVIRHILIHELIHIEIPARDLREGEDDPRIARQARRKRTTRPAALLGPISHPPEFWERESQISLKAEPAMEWVSEELGGWLQYDEHPEAIMVREKWRKLGRLIHSVGREKALEIHQRAARRSSRSPSPTSTE
jgi:hypothetical protein